MKEQTKENLKWGDEEEEYKTITEYKNTETGKVKVVKKIRKYKKIEKIKKSVLERRKWKKFGRCEGQERGPEAGVTEISNDIVNIELTVDSKDSKDSTICRYCGLEHWSRDCPHKDEISNLLDIISRVENTKEDTETINVTQNYRNNRNQIRITEPTNAIRINGLSEEADKDYIYEKFRRYGELERVHLVRDRDTNKLRGFGFVTYKRVSSAIEALKELNGHGYENQAWTLEYAHPVKN
eukprot:TRINITY_DN2292_c0_g1_i2.p1 TRINITY_DN2292_c0_g1~~TRINITY_DN2292_c0_g1_i2.p1  ORF type:complete len:239 (-),score=91.65 TRINITY_DN2292_c0_g1_i2:63-779(-)